jgi:hypothetical protein
MNWSIELRYDQSFYPPASIKNRFHIGLACPCLHSTANEMYPPPWAESEFPGSHPVVKHTGPDLASIGIFKRKDKAHRFTSVPTTYL